MHFSIEQESIGHDRFQKCPQPFPGDGHILPGGQKEAAALVAGNRLKSQGTPDQRVIVPCSLPVQTIFQSRENLVAAGTAVCGQVSQHLSVINPAALDKVIDAEEQAGFSTVLTDMSSPMLANEAKNAIQSLAK